MFGSLWQHAVNVWTVSFAILALLTSLIAIYAIVPNTAPSISVAPGSPLESNLGSANGSVPEDRLQIVLPFRVSNDGKTRVHELQGECMIHELRYTLGPTITGRVGLQNDATINFLDQDRQVDMSCEGGLGSALMTVPDDSQFEYADISFFLSYKPHWRPERRSEEFHVILLREPDGRFRWFSQEPSNLDPESVVTSG